MPEIRQIQTQERKIAVVEDPNSTFSRIFIEQTAYDLSTLTPYWTKVWHYNFGGSQISCAGNAALGGTSWTQYWSQCFGPGQGNMRRGYPAGQGTGQWPWAVGTGQGYFADGNIQFPVTDDGFFRPGIMHLQKGTISCYAAGDGNSNTITGSGGARNYMNFQLDTFHQSLDFYNYPALKSKKLDNNNVLMLLPGDRGIALGSGQYAGNAPWINGNDAWFLYGSDITANDASYSTIAGWNGYTTSSGFNTAAGSTILYEDSANSVIWTVSNGNSCKPFVTRITNYQTTTPTIAPFPFWNSLNGAERASTGNINYRLFFVGVDISNTTYWLHSNDGIGGNPWSIYKCTPTQPVVNNPTVVFNNVSANSGVTTGNTYVRTSPSNIRRDVSNGRYVFYSSHFDTNFNLQPIRFIFYPSTGNVDYHACQMVFPATPTPNVWATYSQIPNFGNGVDSANNSNPWMLRPMQFTSNGNNYITFWFADQAAGVLQISGSYPSQGTNRWSARNQRALLTFTMPSGNTDNVLTYHSTYFFPTTFDIPKNFMPLDANGTTMIVPSTYKTSFFRWNDTSGWFVGTVYQTEFRSMGIDSTGRIWGYAMDKNNGALHIIDRNIPVNVAVVLANTNFTYTGTPLAPTANVNAYDFFGNRLTANVTLTIDGGTMVFATNSSKTLSLQTSNTTDTVVNLTINGGGVNNIYAAISV
jgi:hypothetical protein